MEMGVVGVRATEVVVFEGEVVAGRRGADVEVVMPTSETTLGVFVAMVIVELSTLADSGRLLAVVSERIVTPSWLSSTVSVKDPLSLSCSSGRISSSIENIL